MKNQKQYRNGKNGKPIISVLFTFLYINPGQKNKPKHLFEKSILKPEKK